MKLSSLKFCMAWCSAGSHGVPAMSGNQTRSSSVGLWQMRRMSRYMEKPSA
jgi:type IV secretory pathway protease TraF